MHGQHSVVQKAVRWDLSGLGVVGGRFGDTDSEERVEAWARISGGRGEQRQMEDWMIESQDAWGRTCSRMRLAGRESAEPWMRRWWKGM